MYIPPLSDVLEDLEYCKEASDWFDKKFPEVREEKNDQSVVESDNISAYLEAFKQDNYVPVLSWYDFLINELEDELAMKFPEGYAPSAEDFDCPVTREEGLIDQKKQLVRLMQLRAALQAVM
ncbi:MAG TPA: hypothetical protein VLG69_00040 [Candidatus Andersenbacteria bacterium]|nr:hypothetical protein [Candidatus Andersenbacteria bacterium]